MHANFFFVLLATMLGIGGLVSGNATAALVGAAFVPLCFTPALLGASLDGGVLRHGYRFRRHRVMLADVESVSVGLIEGLGPYSIDAMGMELKLASGEVVLVWESAYCTRRRLNSWAKAMKSRQPSLVVKNM